jgi:hypothetical protein
MYETPYGYLEIVEKTINNRIVQESCIMKTGSTMNDICSDFRSRLLRSLAENLPNMYILFSCQDINPNFVTYENLQLMKQPHIIVIPDRRDELLIDVFVDENLWKELYPRLDFMIEYDDFKHYVRSKNKDELNEEYGKFFTTPAKLLTKKYMIRKLLKWKRDEVINKYN